MMNQQLSFAKMTQLVLIGFLAVFYGFMWFRVLGNPRLRTLDFVSFYGAGRMARAADYSHIYDLETATKIQRQVVQVDDYIALMFLHPPYLVPLLAIISVDDYVFSYILWTIVRLPVVVACAELIRRFLLRNGWDRRSALLGAISCALSYPLFISILGGQDTAFSLLGLLIWMSFILAGNEAWSALGLALSTLAPTIGGALAIACFASRARAAVWFTGSMLLLGVYSFFLVGLGGTYDFFHLLGISSGAGSYGIYWSSMYNLLGILARAWKTLSINSVRMTVWVAYFIITIWLAFIWAKTRHLRIEHIGLGVLAVVFASPHLYFHSLSFLIVPMLGCLLILWQRGFQDFALLFIPAISVILLCVGILFPGMDYLIIYPLMAGMAISLFWSLRSDRQEFEADAPARHFS